MHDDLDDWIYAACDDGFDPAASGWLFEEDDTLSGPVLQDSELRAAHSTLTVPRPPRDFQAAVKALHRRTTSKVLFNNPRQKFLLDAWSLAEFVVRFKSADQAWLSGPDDQWPDGYVRVGETTKNVEVTIADMPGRKMGKEYRTDSGIEFDPVEDWAARADAIPEALETAIRKKIAKRYGSGVWLVIYLNLNDYGIRHQQTKLIIAQVKQKYANTFDALFVLWKDRIYLTASTSRPCRPSVLAEQLFADHRAGTRNVELVSNTRRRQLQELGKWRVRSASAA